MTTAVILPSVLFPAKGWFGPDQAWNVTVRPPAGASVRLILTDFSGSSLDPDPALVRDFDKEGTIDVKRLYPAMTTAGTYLLYAVPKAAIAASSDFVGTPIVITVREDRRRGARGEMTDYDDRGDPAFSVVPDQGVVRSGPGVERDGAPACRY